MNTPVHRPPQRKRGTAARLALAASLLLGWGYSPAMWAGAFEAWRQQADLEVPAPGWVELPLSPELLDAARPGLEDLRVVDSGGLELPYLLLRPVAEPAVFRPVRSFRATLQDNTTRIELETGQTAPLDAVRLETPQRDFLKAARLEGSADGQDYRLIAEGVPLFHQAGVRELTIRFPAKPWPWLRLTLDDQRSPSVVVTGASVQTAGGVAPMIPTAAAIRSLETSGSDTRIEVNLGAANLTVAEIELDTPDILFQREVILHTLTVGEDGLRETEIGRGILYCIDPGTGIPARQNTLALDRPVPSREIILVIRNLDSPPLEVRGVKVRHRPVLVRFQARQSRAHRLLVGNPQGAAPRYDLAALGHQLGDLPRAQLTAGNLVNNPQFRSPEILPGLGETGATLDTEAWRYRRGVAIAEPGPQQLELDLEVLSRARPDLGDLRLMRGDHQVPYVVEYTSLTRSIAPEVVLAPDPKRPSLSRWKLKLSGTNQPLSRLECYTATPLFERQVRLWEQTADGRGGKWTRDLGTAHWQRTPGSRASVLTLDLTAAPLSDTLFLETDNGDNPALELGEFCFRHPVTRLVFKAQEGLELYYGQAHAPAPRYDLALVARQLLTADRATATLGPGEVLRPPDWREGDLLTGRRAILFWGALVVVVVGLLVILARLLPKSG